MQVKNVNTHFKTEYKVKKKKKNMEEDKTWVVRKYFRVLSPRTQT